MKSEIIIEPTIEIVEFTNSSEEVLNGRWQNRHDQSPWFWLRELPEGRAVARQAVTDLGFEARVEHITDYAEIHKYPILATPGLVINEKLVCAGRIPTEAEVTTWLTNAEMETV